MIDRGSSNATRSSVSQTDGGSPSSRAHNSVIESDSVSLASVSAVVYDVDAQAFITASGNSNITQKNAINQLVINLKGHSLWAAKLKAIYPIVGGTASAHKWNLRDPRDLDAAFRLLFTGDWTHSGTGMLPDGTTAYADTKFIPSANLTIDNTHVSVYLQTSTAAGNKTDIGAYTSGAETTFLIGARNTGDVMNGDSYNYGTDRLTFANAVSTGHFIENRTAINLHNIWKNGSKLGSNGTGARSSALPTTDVLISAAQAGVGLSDREVAFATIGTGLTDADAANLYSDIQAFETALSRQV